MYLTSVELYYDVFCFINQNKMCFRIILFIRRQFIVRDKSSISSVKITNNMLKINFPMDFLTAKVAVQLVIRLTCLSVCPFVRVTFEILSLKGSKHPPSRVGLVKTGPVLTGP